MRNHILLISLLASLTATGCKQTECGDGTIERDGQCEPATVTTSAGICGPFTELQGDKCVPQFPPTECDPATTAPMKDPATGVTTCIGTGGGGCGSPLVCPPGTTSTKLTICGQLYNIEDNAKFADPNPTATRCNLMSPASSGPCALQILAFDAISFGTNPSTATPLTVGDVYIDDCGRYRLTDIETNGTGPFIGLGIDDGPPGSALGPTGATVTVGIATPKPPERYVTDFEAWIVNQTTVGKWQASGGPPLSGGIYAAIFRQHKKGNGDQFANQDGVTITKSGNTIPTQDYYFTASETTRMTVDAAAIATGANGTGLLTGASVADSVVYSGQNGITSTSTCRWEPHAAASLPGIVFLQIYRKIDQIGQTCTD